jgi:hypothetical protein
MFPHPVRMLITGCHPSGDLRLPTAGELLPARLRRRAKIRGSLTLPDCAKLGSGYLPVDENPQNRVICIATDYAIGAALNHS